MDALFGQRCQLSLATVVASLSLGFLLAPTVHAQPQPSPAYLSKLVVENTDGQVNGAAQMTWGPDGRLYVITAGNGVVSFQYNRATGKLSNRRQVVPAATGSGLGIGFHGRTLYLSLFGPNNTCAIGKLEDRDNDGVYGETGELFVRIVTGIPTEAHAADNLVIQGDTLFIGIGTRTYNGRRGNKTMGSFSDNPGETGFWSGGTGFSWGESALGGTICWIKDLRTVIDREGSANTYTNTTRSQFFFQQDDSPLKPQFANATNKLLIHSAGTRNPFGLCLDQGGNLYFTSNFNRTNTNGDGTAGPGIITNGEYVGPDFENDVHDQCFKASEGADYGYWNDNWRPKNPMLDPTKPGYHRVNSLTFDNLFNKGPYTVHDPANPDGLGPHSSSNGCAFFYNANLPTELQGNLFIARWVNTIWEDAPGRRNLKYADIVAVETQTGKVRRVAENFQNPLAVLSDGRQRLLVADYGNGQIYSIRPLIRRADITPTLTRVNGRLQATVTITNTGDFPLNNVRLNNARLSRGRYSVAPITNPTAISSLAPGASATRTLVFPTNMVRGTVLQLTGSLVYNGGANGVSVRITAP